MTHLLSCRAVTKAFGAQTLFTGVHLVINEGDRIGLIGPNGSGKSTLLKIICGLESEDDGAVLRRRNLVVGYLPQEDCFIERLSSVENIIEAMRDLPLDETEKRSRALTLLGRARLVDHDLPVAELSGGWRKRVSICRALAVAPDLIVMDEPTNHLDIAGIIWLEELCADSTMLPATSIVVSHDRHFLATSTNRIVELSGTYSSGSFEVTGSYTTFLKRRLEFLDRQSRLEERLRNKVERETEWLNKSPKARTSKAKFRIDEALRLKKSLARVKKQNRAEGRVALDFEATGRKTKKLLEAVGLGKSYESKQIFSDLDMILTPRTRLGLVGANGCGKSTLMNILADAGAGLCAPDCGTIRVADGAVVSAFRQDRSTLDPERTLRRTLAPEGDAIIYRGRSVHVVSWATRFLFRPDQLETPVGRLSGGEQARILIADLMRLPADILLLDEPTNDLDIASLDVLEESLSDFGGAIVLVTHDRYLLDRMCTQVLGFLGDGRTCYYSDYAQWLRDLECAGGETGDGSASDKHKEPVRRDKKKGRLSYMDQREYDEMEARITAAEEDRDRLEHLIEDPAVAVQPEKLQSIWHELERARALVEQLYERWDELEEKREEGV